MIVFLFLLSFAGSLGNKAPIAEIELSTEQHEALFSPWLVNVTGWHRYEEGWFLALQGNQGEEKGLRIFRWSRDDAFKLLGYTTAREGFRDARALAVNRKGDRILLKGLLSSVVFRFDPQSGEFNRFAIVPRADVFMFWDDERAFYGNRYPDNHLQPIGEISIAELGPINRNLTDDAYHPSEGIITANLMYLARNGAQLAVGYSLYEKVLLIKDGRSTEVSIRFPDLIPPPKTFIKDMKDPRNYFKWEKTFHKLDGLRWFRNELYVLFRKGFKDAGLWVKVYPRTPEYRWNNNSAPFQVIAMEGDEVIRAESQETEEAVTWRIWRTSSLP